MKLKTIFLSFAAFALFVGGLAYAGPYLDSAHGNSGYGVLWTTGPLYPQGNCGHCHVQHDSIDDVEAGAAGQFNFALFYDDYIGGADLFCFECHRETDLGYGQVVNNPYCVNFGGYSPAYYQSIKRQFTNANSKWTACGSRHNLKRIHNILDGAPYTAWGFNSDVDPCVGCHPPHVAQRNVPPTTSGDLNTCIRLPSKYKSVAAADLLWGDDVGERMDDYASANGGVYQPPYYGDTTSGKYEPTGTAVDYGGDRTPDYVTFCMECHVNAQQDPERDNAPVKAIDWDYDIHGTAHANTCSAGGAFEGEVRAPYVNSADSNYILSCLDCHEPHGARLRGHLIRRMINGEEVPNDTGSCDEYTDWADICLRCHDWPHPDWGGCETCHGDNNGFHGGTLMGGSCTGEPGF